LDIASEIMFFWTAVSVAASHKAANLGIEIFRKRVQRVHAETGK
jgi:hypothetical protein